MQPRRGNHRMEERNYNIREGNLITDIVLPSVFTLLILFCLVQIGFSVMQPGNGGAEGAGESVTAISAFAS